MDKTQKKIYDDHDQSNKRNSSNFLCCFGFSRKLSEKKSRKEIDGSDINYRKKIIIGRFSWPKFRGVKNPGIKTVPVLMDTTVSEKPQKDTKKLHYWLKPKSKSKTEKLPSPPTEIHVVVAAAQDPTPKEKPNESTDLEDRRNSASGTPSHSSKDDTCQKRLSFNRKIESIRAGSSQPGSPLHGNKPKYSGARSSTAAVTRQHSDSFPGPNRDRPRHAQTKPASRESGPAAGSAVKRFEPLVGMSVVMVTLVIMVLWGRLCAILCTSAWLYFVPRLSSAVGSDGVLGNGSGSRYLDLGSEEYKKKVVFEGFLERNHRSSLS